MSEVVFTNSKEELTAVVNEGSDLIPTVIDPVFEHLEQVLRNAPAPLSCSSYFMGSALVYMAARLLTGTATALKVHGRSDEDIKKLIGILADLITSGVSTMAEGASDIAINLELDD
jgi:hypothetical protein